MLVLNTDEKATNSLAVPATSKRYTLTAHDLSDKLVQLNGVDLQLSEGDALPELNGSPARAGEVTFATESITFLALTGANNAACRP